MANRLKMAKIQAILTLHDQKWPNRRISRELGVDRETVGKYVRAGSCDSKPAKAPTGSALEIAEGEEAALSPAIPELVLDTSGSKPAKAPPGSGTQSSVSKPATAPIGSAMEDCVAEAIAGGGEQRSQSACEPYRQVILDKLATGLSAQRIYDDLAADGFSRKYHSVRRFVAHLQQTRPLPFRRMECAAGEEAQVDFGSGAWIEQADRKRRRPHIFRIVLSHSRKGYSEASYRQTTEDFLRCLENAFWAFGGVPKVLVIDNLRAAVKQPDWYDPELNPILESFCRHYNVVILPTKPRTPRHKGKIERGVGYVKGNALKDRTFVSLEAENQHLRLWEATVADTRIHGTTRKHVGQVFVNVERPALQPLPSERFPFFHEAQRVVHRDGHISVAKAYYSAPPEYVGHEVWVRWDSRMVRIFNCHMQQIAVHPRQEPGRFSTLSRHIPAEKISGVERGAVWLLSKVRLIGPQSVAWAEAMLQARGLPGVRVLQGLLSLSNRYPDEALEKACKIAHSYRAYQLRPLRQLLKRGADALRQTCFIEEHQIIRPLTYYTAWIAAALRNTPAIYDPDAGPAGFLRHDEGVRVNMKKGPQGSCPSGLGAFSTRPRSGYPSSGCSSAEPESVSPDIPSVTSVSTIAKELLT